MANREPSDPSAVFGELQRRELRDLEQCRIAWTHSGDPLAVAVAATKAGLPEWLTDAIVGLLTVEPDTGAMLRRAWKRRRTDAIDAARATELAGILSHPEGAGDFTWDEASAMAEAMTRDSFADLPQVGPDAIKKSYQRVCRGLENKGRYFRAPGFGAERQAALQRLKAIIEAQLAESGELEAD